MSLISSIDKSSIDSSNKKFLEDPTKDIFPISRFQGQSLPAALLRVDPLLPRVDIP